MPKLPWYAWYAVGLSSMFLSTYMSGAFTSLFITLSIVCFLSPLRLFRSRKGKRPQAA